jgi:hypothetical protein
MKTLTVVLSLLISLSTFSQQKLDYGKVETDSSFDCTENTNIERLFFDVGNICNSKNELEIRLDQYALRGNNQLIILTYSNEKWGAEKYKKSRQGGGVYIDHHSTYNIPDGEQFIWDVVFRQILDSLKYNNIFLLPDQSKLNVDMIVHDGVGYRLTFKAGNKFRSYFFNNPESYQEEYDKIPEFKNYVKIYKTLVALFKEE